VHETWRAEDHHLRGFNGRLAFVMGLVAVGVLSVNTVRAARADDAWRARIEGELVKVEAGIEKLDQITRAEGTLLERVKRAHERLAALEKAATIVVGVIQAKDDLAALTQDVVQLKTRLAMVVADRAGPVPEPKPKPKAEKPKPAEGPKPEPPAKPPWPETLSFKATSSLTYTETGEWFIDSVHRSGLGNDFLQDGYQGTISISVRAGGLLREIKEAQLRVAVEIDEPFTTKQGLFRIYELTWTAQRSIWNDALKSWAGHDTISVSGPIRWIQAPKKHTRSLRATAYVVSVRTKDNQVINFKAQEFQPASR